MQTLTLNLAEKSYPIYIGNGLLTDKSLLLNFITGSQVMIVTNTTIAPLYLGKVEELFANYEVKTCILADGEQYKTLAQVEVIWQQLLSLKFSRNSTLVALGGGVIGDSAGFAAACYQRGVNFVQIPTTLLSQVDSSVGGKTGVNHPLAKNMIGAFYQPKCVVIDIDTLNTLDNRQYSAGMAEVIKYALLGDIDFLLFLENNISKIMARDKDILAHIIYKSCATKAQIVAQDELEQGTRALLNLGHTFGHAIENSSGYGKYLHGEAIAIGMVMATDLSSRMGFINHSELKRVISILQQVNLPVKIGYKLTLVKFVLAMSVDKKVQDDGVIALILLKALGQAFISKNYDKSLLEGVINDYIKL